MLFFAGRAEADDLLLQKLQRRGVMVGHDYALVRYIPYHELSKLDSLVTFGFIPSYVSAYDLCLGLSIGRPGRKYDVWAKSTIDALVSRGFRLDATRTDLVILDETKEVALQYF